MTLLILFVLTALLFLLLTVKTLRALRVVGRLPQLPPDFVEPPASVRCSVIVAARDEEARIEQTVRRILSQRGIDLELIVVDDRSTDRTGDILSRLAAADGRLQVARVESLPDGWLGKSHACHIGASRATGAWMLFTDADCWMPPDAIIRGLHAAADGAADHVTLTPGVVPDTLAAQAYHLSLLTRLVIRMADTNRGRASIGLGAFNLVRAAAYRECGGYETLRLTVVDDVKLGLLLQRAGKRTRAFIGGNDVLCHWGTTVPAMIRIMEKNYFAAADYRAGPVIAMAVVLTVLFGAAIAGALIGSAAGLAAALASYTPVLPAAILARRLGWTPLAALLAPLMLPVLVFTVVRSMVVTLRQGGVRWRDRFYPLETVRAANVR